METLIFPEIPDKVSCSLESAAYFCCAEMNRYIDVYSQSHFRFQPCNFCLSMLSVYLLFIILSFFFSIHHSIILFSFISLFFYTFGLSFCLSVHAVCLSVHAVGRWLWKWLIVCSFSLKNKVSLLASEVLWRTLTILLGTFQMNKKFFIVEKVYLDF